MSVIISPIIQVRALRLGGDITAGEQQNWNSNPGPSGCEPWSQSIKHGRKTSATSTEHLLCPQPKVEERKQRGCLITWSPAQNLLIWAHSMDEEN